MYNHVSRKSTAYLSGFSTTSFSDQHNRAMFLDCLHEAGVVLPNGKVLSLLQDLPEPCRKGPTCVLVYLDLGYGRGWVGSFGGRGGGGRGGASTSVIIPTTDCRFGVSLRWLSSRVEWQICCVFFCERFIIFFRGYDTGRVKQRSIRDTHVHMSY